MTPGSPKAADAAPPPLRRRLRARALRGLVRTAGWLPPGALARGLRPLASRGLPRRYRDVLEENVAAANGGLANLDPRAAARARETEPFSRDVARFAAEQAAHWVRLARGARGPRGAWVDELVTLDPTVERLDAVLAEGRGAIVVTAHIGNWELLCARLARRGHRGAVVGRVRRNDPSHLWLVDMRRAYGIETIPQDAPPRQALDVLRSGGVLGLLTDLRVRQLDGVELPFLGTPALTMTAPAAFARVHRAPLVPVRCVREGTGYRLSVDAPLELDRTLARHDAMVDLLTRQNELFGRWIAETPEQWAWHQRRWALGSDARPAQRLTR